MGIDRRLDVLRAIISEYVATREPVGSKAIAAEHQLGVSPATIRNDMAVLEEHGYIYQPHTSAGRVPTERGYRLFVDRLRTLKPMSVPERRAIERFLSHAVDLDDVVSRTVRLLARLTNQVAIVEYPSLESSVVRRVELVPLEANRVLLVVITDAGRVEQSVVEVERAMPADDVRRLRALIEQRSEDVEASSITPTLSGVVDAFPESRRAPVRQVCGALAAMLRPAGESRIVMAGIANIARSRIDFRDIGPVLDALEEQVALLRLFSELHDEAVHVSIGTENRHTGLSEASVVAGGYESGEGTLAHLGVVGPTRMNYPQAMATVRAVAAYLSRFLAG